MLTIDQTHRLRLMGHVLIAGALALILAGVAACVSEANWAYSVGLVGLGGVLLIAGTQFPGWVSSSIWRSHMTSRGSTGKTRQRLPPR